ncbi:crossover junction endodeoxyribonuclease RuvC [Clostridioides difficile]|uniref:crossover junction endodeoxyribonuclease RuvC n=1 Tax=Clostridioides difficile TaxID=1496 RepID=UPI00038D8912|nr:crossover junction endodeoxyribonuclease RuvC [Clostridioides difficile]EQJ88725.1 lactococcus phage M3 family protein [Clostridioides difficile P50]MCO8835385.1 crossover junction endodeoxyribonuclease RuvC [Clostridioides difficile]MCR1410056.1 crossover junction endodeoxyribonuclease RuvC [Clostridioides difficile]MCR1421045.1 crossover junction endodeoxyribonuclease RuvC [Clostridioides difficile]MDI0326426.1 crossover junction endodeoxyribonuclease RuvC [Clostridioides difficile]
MVLALDVSMSSTGWAVINRNKEILKYGKIVTKKDKFDTEDERMCHICNTIQELIITYNIQIVLVEDQFTSRNSKTILSLRKLLGSIMRTVKLNNIEIEYMYPVSIRKYLMNSGKAKKEEVAAYVRENIIDIGEYIDRTCKAKTSDIYDAIALGIAYLNKLNTNK